MLGPFFLHKKDLSARLEFPIYGLIYPQKQLSLASSLNLLCEETSLTKTWLMKWLIDWMKMISNNEGKKSEWCKLFEIYFKLVSFFLNQSNNFRTSKGCLNFEQKKGHVHNDRIFFSSKKKVIGAKPNKTWAKATLIKFWIIISVAWISEGGSEVEAAFESCQFRFVPFEPATLGSF